MKDRIIRMGHYAIEVADVNRAIEFYSENFGFEIGLAADDWGIVRKAGDDLAFIKKGVSSHPPHFGLRVRSINDVDELFEDLRDKVKVLREPKLHRDKSYSFYFTDPDSNVVEVIFDPNNP